MAKPDFMETSGHEDLYKSNRLSTLSWYLMVLGIVSILVAGLFIYLRKIPYRDFVLDGNGVGRYFLFAGIAAYIAGRAISYFQKYRKK
jgi:hypothetical protein